MISIDAETLRGLVPDATELVEAALAAGLDPAADPARTAADVPAGQLLLMPSAGAGYAGVKIAAVAPRNPARGLARIQGVYVLFDGATLAPVALIDAAELTALRTPAVSAVAVKHLAVPDAGGLTVFGTGPQAWGHIRAVAAVRPVTSVRVIGRDPGRAAALAARCRGVGLAAVHIATDTADAGDAVCAAVAGADVIVCCTTARTPLFSGELVSDHAVVVAVGSHEPTAREVDGALVARSTVVVEELAAALREAGDLVIPLRDGTIGEQGIAGDLAALVRGRLRVAPERPRLFKGVGMAWQDLVVAAAAHDRHGGGPRPPVRHPAGPLGRE